MGQKFFDMHESSRLNMSFNCSGAFNIIYIMRSMMMENGKQPPSVNLSLVLESVKMMPSTT